jgi:hypothetical protein
VCLHTANVTTGTLKKMHWEVLPHPAYIPNLTSSNFHLFGQLKEAQGGKRFGANNEVKLSMQ